MESLIIVFVEYDFVDDVYLEYYCFVMFIGKVK